MKTKVALIAMGCVHLFAAAAVSAQPAAAVPSADRYLDPDNGLSIEQAVERALQQEPSVRAARSRIDIARALRHQASLRPNPTGSFERREEPGGTDNQTMLAVQWPLDLFRRAPRITVAEREVVSAELDVADRERVLAADVRQRYGEVAAAVRHLTILDEVVSTAQRQHELLRSRVDEGASPPLERDLVEVELQRFGAERYLQAGRVDAALFELKRVLGMSATAALALRDTLEELVHRDTSFPLAGEVSEVIDDRADVLNAAARMQVADAQVGRAEAEGRFDMTVFANYMRMDAGFPQRAFAADGSLQRVRGLFQYIAAGAMITLPIFDRNQGAVAAARAERAGAEATYDAARLAAEAELAAARARDMHAREAVNTYRAAAQALARQNLTVVRQSYELGRVTVFDVLAEQRRYLDVERAYTETLLAAFEARTALRRALGERP